MTFIRGHKGQALTQGVGVIALVAAVSIGAIALIVNVGTTIYFTDKLGFICNQLSIKFSGFAGDIDTLPTARLQQDAVALCSADGLRVSPSNVTVSDDKIGVEHVVRVTISNASAPLIFPMFGATVPVSSSAVALSKDVTAITSAGGSDNSFNNYNDVLLLPTFAGNALFPGFVGSFAQLPDTTSPGGSVSVCLIRAKGGGAPALGQFCAPGIPCTIVAPH